MVVPTSRQAVGLSLIPILQQNTRKASIKPGHCYAPSTKPKYSQTSTGKLRHVQTILSIQEAFMLLLIDNYDSFTYNLYQYLAELGADITVYRNDQVTLGEIEAMQPHYISISPGPCAPHEAGL